MINELLSMLDELRDLDFSVADPEFKDRIFQRKENIDGGSITFNSVRSGNLMDNTHLNRSSITTEEYAKKFKDFNLVFNLSDKEIQIALNKWDASNKL